MGGLQLLLNRALGAGPTQATGASDPAATESSVEFLEVESEEVSARARIQLLDSEVG